MEETSPLLPTDRTNKGRWKSKLKWTNITVEKPSGKTLLHRAVITDKPDAVSILVSTTLSERSSFILTISKRKTGLDVNAQDEIGRTALHWAAALRKAKCVNLLIKHSETNCTLQDKDGKTPLHEAAIEGCKKIVKELLEIRQICDNIDTEDNRKRTALHWAAENADIDVVRLLVGKGADIWKKDDAEDTAMHRSAKRNDRTTAMFLLQSKPFQVEEYVRILEIMVKKWDGFGDELLHWAAKQGCEDVVQPLLTVGVGVDVLDQSKDNRSPLMVAVNEGHATMVGSLIDKGADININDRDGYTPLSLAIHKLHRTTVQMLLSKGADVNQTNTTGNTPLLWAVKGGFGTSVAILLRKGATAAASNQSGQTALSIAVDLERKDIVQLLESRIKGRVSRRTDNFSPHRRSDRTGFKVNG